MKYLPFNSETSEFFQFLLVNSLWCVLVIYKRVSKNSKKLSHELKKLLYNIFLNFIKIFYIGNCKIHEFLKLNGKKFLQSFANKF